MNRVKSALLVPLSLALLSTGLSGTAQADKYNDQKSAHTLAAEEARHEADQHAREQARLRAEIKKDVGLSCDQIADEVVKLDRIIHEARILQSDSRHAGTGVNVAKTVGSLLVGSLGGVVGIVAVGALAGEAADSRADRAAITEENAEERQNRLAGIFDGKGCEGELALTGEDDHQQDLTAIAPAAGPAKSNKPRYNP